MYNDVIIFKIFFIGLKKKEHDQQQELTITCQNPMQRAVILHTSLAIFTAKSLRVTKPAKKNL